MTLKNQRTLHVVGKLRAVSHAKIRQVTVNAVAVNAQRIDCCKVACRHAMGQHIIEMNREPPAVNIVVYPLLHLPALTGTPSGRLC